jgi:uncharacterized membrane protein YphA (DoxX/SURF4 family)
MNNTTSTRSPLSRKIDLGSWLLIIALMGLIPLLVTAMYTPPAKGPVKSPVVLVMFLTFLASIVVSSIALWGGMAMGRVKSVTAPTALTRPGANVVNVLSKFIAALFLISGFVKLQDITGFSYKLDDYWYVFQEATGFFPASFMKTLSVPIAWFVSVFEMMLAFALLTAYRMRLTSALLMLMLLFFTFLTGYSAITETVTDCGCFGDALKLTPWETFTKDIVLIFTALPIYLLRKRIQPYYRKPLPLVATVGSFLIFGFISYYSFTHLPFIDFRGAYTPGQDLEYNATTFDEEEGLPYAHDFGDFCSDCGQNGWEGPVLYVILYHPEGAPQYALDEMAALEKKMRVEAPGIKVCGGTNGGKDMRKVLNDQTSEAFCLAISDEKTLKTIVRSSPGYMLLKDGIVIKKWHYKDIPSVDELRKMVGPAADMAPPPPPAPEPIPVPVDTSGVDTDSTRTDSIPDPG